jgi:hypothetical protein
MNDIRTVAGAVGFAFVAAWIGFSFGEAILCLLGAAGFYLAAAVLTGKLDLGELQARFADRAEAESAPAPAPRPPRPARPRVQ